MNVTAQKQHFEQHGYVVVSGVFDPQRDFEPVKADYAQTLDALADTLYAQGKLSWAYSGLPFNRRYMQVVAETAQPWSQHFDISLPQSGISDDTPIHVTEAVFNLLRHPALLDVVEQFVGSEIFSSPIQHVRIKVPERLIPPEKRRASVSSSTAGTAQRPCARETENPSRTGGKLSSPLVITTDNLHGEIDTGDATGNEVW